MSKYRWTMKLEFEADEEIEAEQHVEDFFEGMIRDPGGIVEYGKLEKQIPSENIQGVSVWQEVNKGREVKAEGIRAIVRAARNGS